MSGELDLKTIDGDLVFGPDDEPLFIAETDVVAQDVKHRLEESGLTVDLIGDEADPQATLRRIAAEVEKDERIAPGTANATEAGSGMITVRATAIGGESITV